MVTRGITDDGPPAVISEKSKPEASAREEVEFSISFADASAYEKSQLQNLRVGFLN